MSDSSWRTLRLMRHLRPNWPASLLGNTDADLDAVAFEHWLGTLPAQLPAQKLLTSPLLRCRRMAEHLASRYHWPMQELDELREMDFGRFDGMPFSDLAPHWEQLERFWREPAAHPLPDAETLPAFQARVERVWRQLVTASCDADVLVMCHGGIVRGILALLLHADWTQGDLYQRLPLAYGSITEIRIWHQMDEPMFQIVRIAVPYQEYRYES